MIAILGRTASSRGWLAERLLEGKGLLAGDGIAVVGLAAQQRFAHLTGEGSRAGGGRLA